MRWQRRVLQPECRAGTVGPNGSGQPLQPGETVLKTDLILDFQPGAVATGRIR